jgi:hypothetical protein
MFVWRHGRWYCLCVLEWYQEEIAPELWLWEVKHLCSFSVKWVYRYFKTIYGNIIRIICQNYYNTQPNKNKAGEVIADLNAAKSALVESIDKLLDREQKLHLIVTKSDNLGKMSQNISNFV